MKEMFKHPKITYFESKLKIGDTKDCVKDITDKMYARLWDPEYFSKKGDHNYFEVVTMTKADYDRISDVLRRLNALSTYVSDKTVTAVTDAVNFVAGEQNHFSIDKETPKVSDFMAEKEPFMPMTNTQYEALNLNGAENRPKFSFTSDGQCVIQIVTNNPPYFAFYKQEGDTFIKINPAMPLQEEPSDDLVQKLNTYARSIAKKYSYKETDEISKGAPEQPSDATKVAAEINAMFKAMSESFEKIAETPPYQEILRKVRPQIKPVSADPETLAKMREVIAGSSKPKTVVFHFTGPKPAKRVTLYHPRAIKPNFPTLEEYVISKFTESMAADEPAPYDEFQRMFSTIATNLVNSDAKAPDVSFQKFGVGSTIAYFTEEGVQVSFRIIFKSWGIDIEQGKAISPEDLVRKSYAILHKTLRFKVTPNYYYDYDARMEYKDKREKARHSNG